MTNDPENEHPQVRYYDLFIILSGIRMTSVLYSAGLNYQSGNPVRAEIVAVRRDVGTLRKEVEALTEENLIYRKYLLKLLKESEDQQVFNEFTRDLMALSAGDSGSQQQQGNQFSNNSVQGAGFRR